MNNDVVYFGHHQQGWSSEQIDLKKSGDNYYTDQRFENITYGTFGISLGGDFMQKVYDNINESNIWTIDCLIWNLSKKSLLLNPPPMICRVEKSDCSNFVDKDLTVYAKQKGWNLELYDSS